MESALDRDAYIVVLSLHLRPLYSIQARTIILTRQGSHRHGSELSWNLERNPCASQ